jgi:hypothetical protein
VRRWLARNWHEFFAAYWENQIAVARREHDWIVLDHAIDRRNHHERALVKAELAGRS